MTDQQQQKDGGTKKSCSNDNHDNDEDYCRNAVSPDVLEKLEAGAFRSLVEHLQQRSDSVQNIDLMALSGFCRNCLAKWMVLEARRLVDNDNSNSQQHIDEEQKRVLDALGYDEAARYVYGMTYDTWKKAHQKKATSEQMEKFQASIPIQAKHDKQLLTVRAEKKKPTTTKTTTSTTATSATQKPATGTSTSTGMLSNVCCEDVEQVATAKNADNSHHDHHHHSTKKSRTIGPYVPPEIPSSLAHKTLKIGILTVSDRAYKNEYSTGDLSGPAVEKAIRQAVVSSSSTTTTTTSSTTTATATNLNLQTTTIIVPDEMDAIQNQLKTWSNPVSGDDSSNTTTMHIVLTTGGTGMSPRDITPEATRNVIDIECNGLMPFVITECSKIQPLSSLSRGTAGVRNQTLICNLPGNPKGVAEIIPILFPLLLNAIEDICG